MIKWYMFVWPDLGTICVHKDNQRRHYKEKSQLWDADTKYHVEMGLWEFSTI